MAEMYSSAVFFHVSGDEQLTRYDIHVPTELLIGVAYRDHESVGDYVEQLLDLTEGEEDAEG